MAIAKGTNAIEPAALLTNLLQLRFCAEEMPFVVHPFRIVADVIDVDFASGALALRDASGMEFIRVDFWNRDVKPGAKVCLEGTGCALKLSGFGLAVVPGMVADNDGVHPVTTESGRTFLHAGKNPITVKWFNRFAEFILKVEFEGPNLPRQRIPSSVLSRAAGRGNFSTGLDYRCYEGLWEYLPDFGKCQPAKTGVATNFDLNVRTQDAAVGLEFKGFITIPADGIYTFYLASDDGSRLFVGGSSLDVHVLSKQPAPAAADKVPSSEFERNKRPWVALEGTVAYAGIWSEGGELHMRVGNDEIRVEVFEGGDFTPTMPAHSKVRVFGVYEDIVTEEGSRVPGRLLVLNWKAVRPVVLSEIPPAKVSSDRETTHLPTAEGVHTATASSVISTAAEIKALSSDTAKQELPVSIRGVVTACLSKYSGAVVQDSTKGVFVDMQNMREVAPLRRGEFCQIEGVTGPGLYAPVVVARQITHLGSGQLPKPLRPTWDQLVNGSLDTQYAEIDGVVTGVQDQRVVMLTGGGNIRLDLSGFRPETLPGFENALVRIRGCIFVPFNEQTRKLEAGSLRVDTATVHVLQPAPRDLFDAPQKSIEELLLYDPKAASFRLLKVSGQILYGRAGECFLTDGSNGMHVTTRNSELFAVGELVEAAGFLELGGPAAELKEAVMRKTGRARLPAPAKLTPERLLQASHAGTLVQVEATLMNQWREGSEQVLELQAGIVAFRARFNSDGQFLPLPPSGSRLELTGVYAPQGLHAGNQNVTSFELLVDSPAGVRILATPPWWTLKRVLVLAGMLAALLCVVLVWNKQLRWQVQERTRKLETEIRNRQRAELQHAAEAERSRIARDLHDELGTGLTEVSLLASAGLGDFQDVKKIGNRFHAIAEKARALVSGLDVIVWAINPKRNSLQSFADYLGGYAKEFFSPSAIVCRLRIRIECGAVMLTEAVRHSLFLAVKEALNNVIRHASATEVELHISQLGDRLHIVIADNGRGFDCNTIQRGNGMTNLHERLESMQGECHVESQPAGGTTVKFIVPLEPAAELNHTPDKELTA
jgi:signal transduction histidine kinase